MFSVSQFSSLNALVEDLLYCPVTSIAPADVVYSIVFFMLSGTICNNNLTVYYFFSFNLNYIIFLPLKQK